MTLTTAELNGVPAQLTGMLLVCGIYLNELLIRLLHRHDPHPELFNSYQTALNDLQKNDNQQHVLRLFEKKLLLELGYALQLDRETITDKAIEADLFYYFDPTNGLELFTGNNPETARHVFRGASLLALHTDQLINDEFLRDAKRLLRIALGRLLENKPIKSRELFI